MGRQGLREGRAPVRGRLGQGLHLVRAALGRRRAHLQGAQKKAKVAEKRGAKLAKAAEKRGAQLEKLVDKKGAQYRKAAGRTGGKWVREAEKRRARWEKQARKAAARAEKRAPEYVDRFSTLVTPGQSQAAKLGSDLADRASAAPCRGRQAGQGVGEGRAQARQGRRPLTTRDTRPRPSDRHRAGRGAVACPGSDRAQHLQLARVERPHLAHDDAVVPQPGSAVRSPSA
ncbi:hypothetical protein [Pseudonocardia sp. ICBG601]|uniref:hypothetical protein n=1 Tax=Pseudonocardia sp. ICBG601 TaxID=2846759 RepID=UPI001CF71B35|nr:hypothetical protein [Pseudonocardia sp. ICBG601]